MEITINRTTLSGILVFVAILSLLGLGALGKPYTPVTAAGDASLLPWDDWQLFKAEQRYTAEREVLRVDADALGSLLNQNPDPVAAQILAQRISRHTAEEEAALLSALCSKPPRTSQAGQPGRWTGIQRSPLSR